MEGERVSQRETQSVCVSERERQRERYLSYLCQQLRHPTEGSGGFEVVPSLQYQLHHLRISGADRLLQHLTHTHKLIHVIITS